MEVAPVKSLKKVGRKEAAGLAVAAAASSSIRSSLRLCESLPGDDVETVHGARVQARRARLALRLLSSTDQSSPDLARLDAELRWLGRMLGAVRDHDVELQRLDEDQGQVTEPERLAGYRAYLENLRRPAFAALLQARESPPYRHLAALDSDFTPPGKFPYKRLLRRLSKRFVEQADSFRAESPPEEWHALRIRVRRLRYALEALSPVTGNRFTVATRSAVKLQSLLGEMQDRTSGLQFLATYASQAQATHELDAVAQLVHLRIQERDSLTRPALDRVCRLRKALKAANLI